jgi:predicted dehydrogenase
MNTGEPLSEQLNRRDFLKAAAIAARGANDKINIGWITPIFDAYQGYIERAQDRMKTIWGNTPKVYADHSELLAGPSITAVYIMTPEHLHYELGVAAMEANKQMYIEKPMAHTIEEGGDIVRAWKKSGKIAQVGTRNRPSSIYKRAKELIDKGMIGYVHFVCAFWYRNSRPNSPAWRYVIPSEAATANTDWNRFLGLAAKRPLIWDEAAGNVHFA